MVNRPVYLHRRNIEAIFRKRVVPAESVIARLVPAAGLPAGAVAGGPPFSVDNHSEQSLPNDPRR